MHKQPRTISHARHHHSVFFASRGTADTLRRLTLVAVGLLWLLYAWYILQDACFRASLCGPFIPGPTERVRFLGFRARSPSVSVSVAVPHWQGFPKLIEQGHQADARVRWLFQEPAGPSLAQSARVPPSKGKSTTLWAWTIAGAVGLACLSAIFSGLTLGMMTLDVVQLRVLIATAEKNPWSLQARSDARKAKRIYRLRKDGNLLLVTLVVANVAVNSGFTIIASDLTSGLAGLLISTVILTFAGEIIPQVLCSRYGLHIGYYLHPLIVSVELVLYIVVKPIALLLDWTLGPDMGISYNREQLKAFLGHHEEVAKILHMEEARILFGGLDVATRTVASAMTPLSEVFGLDAAQVLNFDTAAQMLMSGFSRVPIFDRSRSECVIGVLYVKDLSLIDPETCHLPLRVALSMLGRATYAVDVDTKLLDVLKEFKKGKSHMAVVREVVEPPSGGDPVYRHIGVITLEDVIEQILQDEIHDEYDAYSEARVKKSRRCSSVQGGPDAAVPASGLFRGGSSAPNTQTRPLPLAQMLVRLAKPCGAMQGDTTGSISKVRLEKQSPPTSHCSRETENSTPSAQRQQRKSKAFSTKICEGLDDGAVSPVLIPLNAGAFSFSPSQPVHRNAGEQNSASTCSSASLQQPPSSPAVNEIPHRLPVLPAEVKPALTAPSQNASSWNAKPSPGCDTMISRLRLFDRRRRPLPLACDEAMAVGLYLSGTEAAFSPTILKFTSLLRMLARCSVHKISNELQPAVCFVRGLPTDTMILTLQGEMPILCGEEAIRCSIGPWRVLGAKALGPPDLEKLMEGMDCDNKEQCNLSPPHLQKFVDEKLTRWMETYVYQPDFTAPVFLSESQPTRLLDSAGPSTTIQVFAKASLPATTPVRYLAISRSVYIAALQESFKESIAERHDLR